MKSPGEDQKLSPRQLPSDPPAHSYPDGFELRSERRNGVIKWSGTQVFVGEAFRAGVAGLQAVDDGLWLVHPGPLRLGVLHGGSRTIAPLEPSVTHVPGCAGPLPGARASSQPSAPSRARPRLDGDRPARDTRVVP